ncbi:MAG: Y4bD/Y4pK family protein [Candidatus Binataceae bacterium]
MGSAEVVHPFHPLRGQRFVVLKIRRVSGVETLSLRHADLGSFAMPREWTDWAPPGAQAWTNTVPLLIDAFGLIALAELVASLIQSRFEVDR